MANWVYIAKRAFGALASFLGVAIFLFFLFRLIPGDVADLYIQPGMEEESIQAIREAYGLTEPTHVQLWEYLTGLATLNLGESFSYHEPVSQVIFSRAVNTMSLMLPALILAYLIGPVIGAFLAWHRDSSVDTASVGMILLFFAAPVFWTGMIAIMFFGHHLGWFPSGGMRSAGYIEESIYGRILSWDFLYHLVLPLTVTTLYFTAQPAFFMRNNMLDTITDDFIKMNEAQGLSKLSLIYRHAARNSMLPVMHHFASMTGVAFGASVVIEVVFSWPGLGMAMWEAVSTRDYPLAQGAFLTLAGAIITMNFIVDMISVYVDPRSAQGQEEAVS